MGTIRQLGNRVKQIRESANLTLGELAEAANITPSQIALIESGESTPSIATLLKIADCMDVRVGTLLDGTETAPSVTKAKSVQPTINVSTNDNSNNLNFHSLAGNKLDRNMEPFYVNVRHLKASDENFNAHEGEEFIYVLKGEVEILYGDESHKLKEGDSIYYDSIVPHLVRSLNEEQEAQALTVTYTPN